MYWERNDIHSILGSDACFHHVNYRWHLIILSEAATTAGPTYARLPISVRNYCTVLARADLNLNSDRCFKVQESLVGDYSIHDDKKTVTSKWCSERGI